MDRTKYVVINEGGFLIPILFSHLMSHDVFADWNPVSTGFVSINPVSGQDVSDLPKIIVAVFGKSDTLGIASKPEDAEIIEKMISPHWC